MKLCETCIYRNNVEQLKPCIIYRDDCKLYERGDMTNEDAANVIKSGLDNNSIDCFDTKQYMAIDMAIKALEQTRWIPVSERLPEPDIEVLVTDDAGGLATISTDSIYESEVTGEKDWYTSQNVTAWMPLPKPYKVEKESIC